MLLGQSNNKALCFTCYMNVGIRMSTEKKIGLMTQKIYINYTIFFSFKV